jgi:tripartite-type tricarboxylate transporter receptor subunit TctC
MKNMKSRSFKTLIMLILLSLVFAISAASVFAAADTYPSKPVRLIIPFDPGGVNDIIARLMAAKLTQRLGKQLIAENHSGGGGIIGLELASKAEPDGHTLVIIGDSFTFKPALYTKLPYDSKKDFTPVVRLASGASALVVHPSVPAKTVKELVALAKQKPDQLICVASGVGSVSHLDAELFKDKAGIDFQIVQFKGAGPATVDLIGGHSHFIISSLVSLTSHIKSGKLRALGTTGLKRSALMPDLATIAESISGYEHDVWWGIVAPAGTPAPIIDRLNNEFKSILTSDDEVKKRLLSNGAEADYLGPAEFGPFIDRQITSWTQIIRKANIKLD